MRKMMILCAGLLAAASTMAQTPASDSKDVDCGQSVTIKATPKDGFHFVQWEDGDLNAERTFTVDATTLVLSFKAIFAADETLEDFDESITTDAIFPVPYGETIQIFPVNDDDCKVFAHWSDIDDPEDPEYAIVPRDFIYQGAAPTFKAVFELKTFNVEVTTDDDTMGEVEVTIVVP